MRGKSIVFESYPLPFLGHYKSYHALLLGRPKWPDTFLGYEKCTVERAKLACQNSGYGVTDHFADVGKMVPIGSDAERERVLVVFG